MTERSKRIGKLMVQVCNESVQLDKTGRDVKARVSLAPDLVLGPGSNPAEMPVANAFELTFAPGLVRAHIQGFNLESLHGARRAFLDALKSGKSPSSLMALPVIHWLLALDATGQLEAYDYWLYGPADPDAASNWFQAHPDKAGGLAKYLVLHPLFPKRGREEPGPTAAIVPDRFDGGRVALAER